MYFNKKSDFYFLLSYFTWNLVKIVIQIDGTLYRICTIFLRVYTNIELSYRKHILFIIYMNYCKRYFLEFWTDGRRVLPAACSVTTHTHFLTVLPSQGNNWHKCIISLVISHVFYNDTSNACIALHTHVMCIMLCWILHVYNIYIWTYVTVDIYIYIYINVFYIARNLRI